VPFSSQSAIGNHAAAMIPYWRRQFDLDVVVDRYAPEPGETPGGLRVMDTAEFATSARQHSRILYHIGTAELPHDSFALLQLAPGIVIVHDSPASSDTGTPDLTAAGPVPVGGPAEVAAPPQDGAHGQLRVDGVVYDGPMLHKVIRHARGVIFESQRSADVVLGAYPDLATIPIAVVPRVADCDVPASRSTFHARPRWTDAQRQPARVAEFDAGVAVHLIAVDHARSAAALSRRIAAIIALDGWDDRLSSSAADAISSGIALHPFSGRWFADAP